MRKPEPFAPVLLDDESDFSFDPDDDAKDAIIPAGEVRKNRTSRLLSIASNTSDPSEADRVITEKGLMRHASPYAGLDNTRSAGLSPNTKPVLPNIATVGAGSVYPSVPMSASRSSFIARISQQQQEVAKKLIELLPHGVVNLDLRTLNLHLRVRTAEILGCSESMWEWVEYYQRQVRLSRRASIAAENSTWRPLPKLKGHEELVDLSREEFDALLSRFEMCVHLLCDWPHTVYILCLHAFQRDMQDHMALGPALEDRFQWSVFRSESTTERLEFQAGCQRWDEWELEEQRKSFPPLPSPGLGEAGSAKQHHLNNSISHSTIPTADEERKPGLDRSGDAGNARRSRSRSNSLHSSSALRPPSTRLSRSLRVFVAWKP